VVTGSAVTVNAAQQAEQEGGKEGAGERCTSKRERMAQMEAVLMCVVAHPHVVQTFQVHALLWFIKCSSSTIRR
jgi:3-hydroxyisobutyrate dehydrogenase-like beta-hydroxyacid dehydrogenase